MVPKSGEQPPRRGEIFWVNLDPTRGNETKKTRPAIIVSNDIGNEFSNIVIIAPITSKVAKIFPFEVAISLEKKNGKIMLNQSRAIDKSRLLNKIGTLNLNEMKEVDEAIKVVFGLS